MSLNKPVLTALVLAALSTTALTPMTVLAKAAAVATVAKSAPVKTKPAAPKKPMAPKAAFVPQTPDRAKGVDFAQNHSDIKADPAVRFGKLSNGLTYIIERNATPPGTASIRMRIGAGSMMENDSQRGLAHFIEHMAFNGSKNVPEGDMVKILERHGLKFGPDTNAFTSFDETVYQLDLPKVDDELVDTGLFIMRETAGNLLLDDGAIDRERGVILGEERLRDTPGLHDYKKWSQAAFGDQKYANRLPIGLVDVINTAKRDRFVDFYSNFYRPQNTTLVFVGDVDPDKLEAKIKAKFGDWTSSVTGDIRATDFGAYTNKGPIFDTYSEPGLPDGISMTWAKPYDDHYENKAKLTANFLDGVRTSLLNDRLERLSKLETTAFSAAGAGNSDVEHTANLTQLNITPKPGKDKAAFAQAYGTVRQFVEFGADQSELDRAIADMESTYKLGVKGEKTRESKELADDYANEVGGDNVITSPTQDYAWFQSIKPLLTLANINAGNKALFSGDGPLVWHRGTDLGDLDKQALQDTYAAVTQAKLAAAETHATKPWPYTSFGVGSKIVNKVEIKDLGITQLTYANGLRATIKSTKFKDDEIGITVRFEGGLKVMSPSAHPPVFAANSLGVYEGGLGKLTASELKDTLTGKIVSVNFGIDDDADVLSGGTTKTDFATQMQALMAFTTDSAYRPEAWDRLKTFLPNYYTRLNAAPGGVFQLKGSAVLHSGDPRFGLPAQEAFATTTNDQIKTLIDTQLKTAPVEITIVGDVTEAEAEAEINKTFATLKPRSAKLVVPADSDTVRFPTQNLKQTFEHHGRADQSISYVAWPGVDFLSDTARARTLTLLAEVLTLRLTDVVREKQGMSYSPNAGNYNSDTFTGYGYLSASAEVKPDQDQPFADAVAGIVADLKAKPIGADELLRAQKPVLDRMDSEWKTNSYWEAVLPGTTGDARRLDAIRSKRAQYVKVTAEDLQKAATQYLDMDRALQIHVQPAATALVPKANDPALAPAKPAG